MDSREQANKCFSEHNSGSMPYKKLYILRSFEALVRHIITVIGDCFVWMAPALSKFPAGRVSFSDVFFAVRTTIAALLALYIALWMELDSPQWAPMTVWIVAHVSRGETLSKARWRVLGTCTGAVMAIALIAITPQQPIVFFSGLSFWLGICCWLSTLLSSFRAYAFVLAGYTCSIVSLDAVTYPDEILTISMSRLTYICLGIFCEGLTACVISLPKSNSRKEFLTSCIKKDVIKAYSLISSKISGDYMASVEYRSILVDLFKLQSGIEFAHLENKFQPPNARTLLIMTSTSILFTIYVPEKARLCFTIASTHGFIPLLRQISGVFKKLCDNIKEVSKTSSIYTHLFENANLELDKIITDAKRHYTGNAYIDVIDMISRDCIRDIATQDNILRDESPVLYFFPDLLALAHHRDNIAAMRNGLRSAMAAFLACMAWLLTAWPSGISFITIVCITCGLFSTRHDSETASRDFLFGTIPAILCSGLFTFVIIPYVNDYEILALTLFPFMVIGGVLSRFTKTSGYALSYNIFFPNLINFVNQNRTNELEFFNSSLALLLGVLFSVLAFRIFFRHDNNSALKRIVLSMIRDVQRLSRPNKETVSDIWLSRNIDRLSCVLSDFHLSSSSEQEEVNCAEGLITIGAALIRITSHLEKTSLLPTSLVTEYRAMINNFINLITNGTQKYDRIEDDLRSIIRHSSQIKCATLRSISFSIIANMMIIAERSQSVSRSMSRLDWYYPHMG